MDSDPPPSPPPSSSSSWSGIRNDLLQMIVNRLDSSMDVVRLRAVCYSWRLLIPDPSSDEIDLFSSGHLKLPFPIGYDPSSYRNRNRNRIRNRMRVGFFNLTENKMYCVEPLTKISKPSKATKSWFIKIQKNAAGKMKLKDPLSMFLFKILPKGCPKFLNVLDYRVIEVSKTYNLEFVEIGVKKPMTDSLEMKSVTVKKVVVSPDPFEVLVIHSGGRLSVWKLIHNKWFSIPEVKDKHSNYACEDIAYHNGMFFAIDFSGLAVSIDSSLEITVMAGSTPNKHESGGNSKYLITSMGDLYLVNKYIGFDKCNTDDTDNCPVDMLVYKLNLAEKKWDLVDGLDDRVFFIGDDCCFSVSATDFAGCKANSIYFNDCLLFYEDADPYPGIDSGLFDLGDCRGGRLSAFPLYCKIFWPPPNWLKPVPRSAKSPKTVACK